MSELLSGVGKTHTSEKVMRIASTLLVGRIKSDTVCKSASHVGVNFTP